MFSNLRISFIELCSLASFFSRSDCPISGNVKLAHPEMYFSNSEQQAEMKSTELISGVIWENLFPVIFQIQNGVLEYGFCKYFYI